MIPICLIALILLIWFKADAWLEYTNLFHLKSISLYNDFKEKQNDDALLTYLIYLRRYHDCFFVRLITCPICNAVWLGIFFSLFTSIFFAPIYIMGGLFLFAATDKLLG